VGEGTPVLGYNPANESFDRVRVDASGQTLTTNMGIADGDNQSSLKAGLRGPTLLEDFILREKIIHFDHERIVQARGYAVHGHFESYQDLSPITKAALFAEAGKRTPVFVRFSTVAGERGSPDLARDVRGFAVKFYTDQGNWDIVGNNMPVFFIQDEIKFPDLIHAVKPEPHNGMPQAASAHDAFWDFVSLMPESSHMLMWVMSDRAIARSLRTMQGFGVHAFRFVNAAGKSRFVKFHWEPAAGTHSVVWSEAVKINGADTDFHRRDLWESIEAGIYPEWELGVQVFTEEEADGFSFDVLDATKHVEKKHIVGAFRFGLTKVGVQAIRERVISMLAYVSAELAQGVADGLGIPVPAAMRKVLESPNAPEVTASPALSLTARPGDGSVRGMKVALLVADGIDGVTLRSAHAALAAEGAAPRFVGARRRDPPRGVDGGGPHRGVGRRRLAGRQRCARASPGVRQGAVPPWQAHPCAGLAERSDREGIAARHAARRQCRRRSGDGGRERFVERRRTRRQLRRRAGEAPPLRA